MAFPAFLGVVGAAGARAFRPSLVGGPEWKRVPEFSSIHLTLWVRDGTGTNHRCWHSTPGTPARPAIFVWGQPLVASDCEFNAETIVKPIVPPELPNKIARLYERLGVQAFALLEGNFCLVAADPVSQSILLVVDKFGCDDIFVRRRGGVAFASHPLLLTDNAQRFDAKPAAFFLAQEGFVPAPFTLFEGIETVGRAKLMRIKSGTCPLSLESEQYWSFSQPAAKLSKTNPVDEFHRLLSSAVESRVRRRNGILLSGGIDSALLANLMAKRDGSELLAMTGAVCGHSESEREVRHAAEVASALGIAHEPVYLDPQDETVPDEWGTGTVSWSGGTRITLPLFFRLASRMRSLLGEDSSAFSGQMADTLADNNYTLRSLGYAFRRMFFSPWFLKIMGLARMAVPRKNSHSGNALTRMVKACAGLRISQMTASLLDGLSSQESFYAGRIFGFGEIPGRSPAFSPVLSEKGFESIADWYSSNFVAPVTARLTPETFYRDMIELSMDMGMLHLDTRLVLHAFRLSGGSADLPFLDSRIVKYFANLPYSARAFYRQPKHVIAAQFRKHPYVRASSVPQNSSNVHSDASQSNSSASFEERLLAGSLGSYFRELLQRRNVHDCVPGLCEFIDEKYLERQTQAFRLGLNGVDYKFISRLAALELWCETSRSETLLNGYAPAMA